MSLRRLLCQLVACKCHLKEGHNRLNCPYPNHCSSSIFCKNVDKHPEDKQAIKELNKRFGEERKRLSSMKEELKNRENACESVKNRYVNRVKEILIASDPEKYITEIDGKSIENWRIINKDSKILEREFKGKIPTPEEAREAILSFDSLAPHKTTGKTTVHEPYKKLWESKGISWPKRHSSKVGSTCSSHKFIASEEETGDVEYDAALCSPQRKKAASERIYQDDYQLALGMQKSYETLPESFNLNVFEGIVSSNSSFEMNIDPDETQDPNSVDKNVGAAAPVVEHLEHTSSVINVSEGEELQGESFRRLNLYDLAEAALQTLEED